MVNARGFEAGDIVTVYGTYLCKVMSTTFGGMRVLVVGERDHGRSFNTTNEHVVIADISYTQAKDL